VVSAAGAVQERYVYDPYGKATVLDPVSWAARGAGSYGTSAFAWAYLHQGGRYARFDDASGLYSFRNRDYSPTLGRWMEQDPLGLDAGDTNLYRYANDAPSAAVDPLGTTAIFFDGAGQKKANRTTILKMYEASKDPIKYYVTSPVAWKSLTEFSRQAVLNADRVFRARAEECKAGRKEPPIDLIGWSRGAALAVATAHEIAVAARNSKVKVEIRFVGLIDPVSTGIAKAPNTIPSIVKTVWLGVRDKSKDRGDPKSPLFPIMDVKLEDPKATKLEKPKKPYPLTHGDTGIAQQVADDLFAAAKAAGMDLNPLPKK
jgi:RHS repeat-associated protein